MTNTNDSTTSSALAAYRDKVRTRAIHDFHDGHWQREDLNAALRRLGLDPYLPRQVVCCTLTLRAEITTDRFDETRENPTAAHFEQVLARYDTRQAIAAALRQHLGNQIPPVIHLDTAITEFSTSNFSTWARDSGKDKPR